MLQWARPCGRAARAASRLPTEFPWVVGPVTFAAVIVPVLVHDVAAGQAGWFPPPHKNIMTPPPTFVGPKCKWATLGFADSPENVNVKVMVPPASSMWNVAVPAELIGGTSLSPKRCAEKTSVAACAARAAQRPAGPAAPAKIAKFLKLLI